MNTDQLLKSGEEYPDYLEGGWSGQNLLLVVCWRKPSLKPEKENYHEVEEVFKYMQQDLIESKEKAVPWGNLFRERLACFPLSHFAPLVGQGLQLLLFILRLFVFLVMA